MLKLFFLLSLALMLPADARAKAADFDHYFKVNMQMDIPNPEEYIKKLNNIDKLYDKGFESRFKMGNKFKKEFSRTIKFYGLSEGRLKNSYEDELLEIIGWLPKESYQYIGPMLHQVPGMSEKILNLPGIKETKNKFPEDVAERFKGMENLEFMSPALYVLLMPDIWDKKNPVDLDKPQLRRAQLPRVEIELPDFLRQKAGLPAKTAEKQPASAKKKSSAAPFSANLRTLHPDLTSPLTKKDVAAFIATIDDIMEFGTKDNMRNYSRLIVGEALLDIWEQETGAALSQNSLKDLVNPCQRLVLKTRFAGLYNEFSAVVAKNGFSAEEWAYTCDKTVKAFRVAEANPSVAYAVRFHRRGYYDQYIEKLPPKWRNEMYASEAAIVKMYTVLKEDVGAVRPFQKELRQKMLKNRGIMLTAPIFY